jgi:hypothetical protein
MTKTKTIAALAALALAAGCATPGERSQASIPEKLKAPAGETLSLETLATGVQIYECGAAKSAPGRYEWVFKGPEADLFDRAGNRIGSHYGGPTWESNDGSKVVAAVQAREDAPDARAIPWLLLEAKSTSGNGVFGRTKRIQRVHTVGGITPAEACGQAEAGKTARVAYTATYYFYVTKQ